MRKAAVVGVVFLVGMATLQAQAAVPEVVSFQARLSDSNGSPVTNGARNVTFRIYDSETAAVGDEIWADTVSVTTKDGLFSVLLGHDTQALGLAFDTQYWLGIEVESDGEMTPRFRLAAAPYAVRAKHAETAGDAATLGGAQVGTADGDIVALEASGTLPAVDGSQLTGVVAVDSDKVDGIHASTTPEAGKLLALDAAAKLPADITGDADTLDGKDSTQFDTDTSNELNTGVTWNDATNALSVTDPGGTQSATITGFLESEADTLASVTGRGASTSTKVTLSGGADFPGSGTWTTSGKVGIGATIPGARLDVQEDAGVVSGGVNRGVFSYVRADDGDAAGGGVSNSAIYAYAQGNPTVTGASNLNYGVSAYAVGSEVAGSVVQNFGVYADASGADGSLNRGVRSRASGSSSMNWGMAGDGTGDNAENYGVQGYAGGANSTNYGIYGYASGSGSTNWAGYFGGGNVFIGGRLGVGETDPTNYIDVFGGAYCSGAMWINGSSREFKDNVNELSASDAEAALADLTPVRFTYRTHPDEECLGFIAEDVPELVATKDRKGMSPMDVVAVLTKVLQEQRKTIKGQQAAIQSFEVRLTEVETALQTLALCGARAAGGERPAQEE